MSELALFIVVLLAGWILGAVLLSRRGLGETRLHVFAFGPGLGLGLLGLVFFFFRWFLDRPPTPRELGGIGAGILLSCGVLRLRRAAALPGNRERKKDENPWWQLSSVMHCAAVLAAATAATAFLIAVDKRPDGGWDGMVIWQMLARTIHRAGGSLEGVLDHFIIGHAGYPQNLPQQVAAFFTLQGSESLFFSHAVAFTYMLSTAAMVYAAVTRLSNRVTAAAAAALLLFTPYLSERAADLYADIPLAYFHVGAALVLATLCLRSAGPGLPAVLGGFFLGMLPWTKNEGWIMAVLLLLVFVFLHGFAAEERRHLRRVLAGMVLGSVPPLAALVLFKVTWAPPDPLMSKLDAESFNHLFEADRWRNVLLWFGNEVANGGDLLFKRSPGSHNPFLNRWASIWIGLLALMVVVTRKRRFLRRGPLRFLGLVVLLQLCAWFLLYVVIPTKQLFHLETSLSRLLLQILPATIVLVCAAIPVGDAEKRREADPDGAASPVEEGAA